MHAYGIKYEFWSAFLQLPGFTILIGNDGKGTAIPLPDAGGVPNSEDNAQVNMAETQAPNLQLPSMAVKRKHPSTSKVKVTIKRQRVAVPVGPQITTTWNR